jgi:predicted transposase YbfD/YdcC
MPKPTASLVEHFGEVTDPRIERQKLHQLLDIIVIAICGVICGADTWVDIELFGHSKLKWLKGFLDLPNGIPSHDTFGRVFGLLDPVEFQTGFLRWVQAVTHVTQGQVIGVDGKQLRRSHDKRLGKAAIYMVSAWASEAQVVLGQRKVADKSNEMTAIPQLLDVLALDGCIVTIDAIGTQTKIAERIVDRGADYVLAVKANQATLLDDIRFVFQEDQAHDFQAGPYDYAKTVNKGHGRIEIRECWSISAPEYLLCLRDAHKWTGLKSLVMIKTQRRLGRKREVKIRYYISSLTTRAANFLHIIRSHWGIENGLHWALDIAFREDESRVRKDHAPQNFAVLRHIALNLLKQEQTARGGIKAKRLQCGWDEQYLLKVLAV